MGCVGNTMVADYAVANTGGGMNEYGSNKLLEVSFGAHCVGGSLVVVVRVVALDGVMLDAVKVREGGMRL